MTDSFEYSNPKINARLWGHYMGTRRFWLNHVRQYEECPIQDTEINREWKAKGVKECLQRAAESLRKIRFYAKLF